MAQMAWYFNSAQFFKSLHLFKSAQFWFWCNAPMHQQRGIAPILVHKWHGTLNQHSFGFGEK